MNTESYIELNLTFNDVDQSLIDEIQHFALTEFGAAGAEQYNIEEARVDEILGDRSYSGGDLPLSIYDEVEGVLIGDGNAVRIKVFFHQEDQVGPFLEFMQSNELSFECEIVKSEVKDWNETWRQNYAPIIVSEKCVVVPNWEKATFEGSYPHKIYIYPGMGFGTGTHETTFLCLKEFNRLAQIEQFSTIIDFGCGSGILGIAAKIIMPETKITLFDIDSSAIENTLQNLKENDLSDNEDIFVVCGEEYSDTEKVDLIFANILAPVLLSKAEQFRNLLKANGVIILSGILNSQKEDVLNHYLSLGLKLEMVESKNDWAMISMRKN